MFGLYDKKRLETFLGGLKSYIQRELNMHDIPNVEVARCKAKGTELKLEEIPKARVDKNHLQ